MPRILGATPLQVAKQYRVVCLTGPALSKAPSMRPPPGCRGLSHERRSSLPTPVERPPYGRARRRQTPSVRSSPARRRAFGLRRYSAQKANTPSALRSGSPLSSSVRSRVMAAPPSS